MDERLTDAAALIAAGRYDQALTLLAALTTPARHPLMGAAFLGRRKAVPALAHFRHAVIDQPGSADNLLGLARAHLQGLDPLAAIALLEALRRRAADLPGLAETLATAYRRDARYEDAVALTVGGDSLSLRYERGLSLLHLGDATGSLAAFDDLLERAPNHAAGWFWSHAPALELSGWDAAERRLMQAAGCSRASRKYQAFLAAYDIVRGAAEIRACPQAYRYLADGARALRDHLRGDAGLFGVHATLLRWSLREARQPGLVAEFGVRRGTSIRVLAGAAEQEVHGFDSFAGLPESWVRAPAGVLSTEGALPSVPANVTLHPGWFADSLPVFLAALDDPIRLINIDSDIYSSARTVLWALAGRLRAGSILLFDELIGNRSWRQDEYRALTEFSEHFSIGWEVIAVNLPGKQVAIRVTATG